MPNIMINEWRGQPVTTKTRCDPHPLSGYLYAGEVVEVPKITDDIELGIERGILVETKRPANRPLHYASMAEVDRRDPTLGKNVEEMMTAREQIAEIVAKREADKARALEEQERENDNLTARLGKRRGRRR